MDAFSYINTETLGAFGMMMIVSVFILVYFSLKSGSRNESALMAASIVSAILSIMMAALEMVSPIVVVPLAVIAIVCLFIAPKEGE